MSLSTGRPYDPINQYDQLWNPAALLLAIGRADGLQMIVPIDVILSPSAALRTGSAKEPYDEALEIVKTQGFFAPRGAQNDIKRSMTWTC